MPIAPSTRLGPYEIVDLAPDGKQFAVPMPAERPETHETQKPCQDCDKLLR